MKHLHVLVFSSVLIVLLASACPAAESASPPFQTAESVVNELYRLVTIDKGETTDWEQVRNLFIPEAVVVLRESKETLTVFSLQGWIDDFVAWDERARASERGFSEKIVRTAPLVFRDIAHVLVLYEASLADSPRPPSQGVDSIELIRKDGRWWIAAITNDLPGPDHPIPAALSE